MPDAERRLNELLESETTPESTKAFIREEMEIQITLRQRRIEALRALKACKGGA